MYRETGGLEFGPLPILAPDAFFKFAACWQLLTAKLFWQHLLLKFIFSFRLSVVFHVVSCSFPIFFAEAENLEEETADTLFSATSHSFKW